MARVLPTHPTAVHPITGKPLRAVYVSDKTGRVYWPIIGATQPPAPAPAPAPPEPTFPANTPVAQMKPEEQAAYWKHYARQHEGRAKSLGELLGDLTPDKLKERLELADRAEALDAELASDAEKAAAKAADEAAVKEREKLQPLLIAAKLETAAALAGVAEADLQTAVEFVDPKKFLDSKGNVDADKVKSFVEKIKPATGTGTPPKGPTVMGHGAGGPATPPAGSAKEKGLAEARRRGFGTPQPQPAGATQ